MEKHTTGELVDDREYRQIHEFLDDEVEARTAATTTAGWPC